MAGRKEGAFYPEAELARVSEGWIAEVGAPAVVSRSEFNHNGELVKERSFCYIGWMPRPVRFTPDTILDRALPIFWEQGFLGTSIDDLTRGVGASRQAIYSAFPDKRALLLACIDSYKCLIVDPAFSIVEQPGAGLGEIAAYFEMQIAASEAAGLPSPGCLLANLTTEIAPRDPQVEMAVQAHLTRLRAGFLHALKTCCGKRSAADFEAWASLLTVTAQGLWSMARVTRDASELRRPVRALLELIEGTMTK